MFCLIKGSDDKPVLAKAGMRWRPNFSMATNGLKMHEYGMTICMNITLYIFIYINISHWTIEAILFVILNGQPLPDLTAIVEPCPILLQLRFSTFWLRLQCWCSASQPIELWSWMRALFSYPFCWWTVVLNKAHGSRYLIKPFLISFQNLRLLEFDNGIGDFKSICWPLCLKSIRSVMRFFEGHVNLKFHLSWDQSPNHETVIPDVRKYCFCYWYLPLS